MEKQSNIKPEKEKIVPFTSSLLLSNKQILDLGIAEEDVELYRRKHYQMSFAIDTWYDALKEHTFRTESFPLTYSEGCALGTYKDKRTEKDLEIIDQIADKIDVILKKHFPNGAFVKLNTRSPKDVPVYDFSNEELHQIIDDEFNSLDQNHSFTDETWAFVKATNKSMKVMNGQEAIRLLANSTRIYEDLSSILNFPEKYFKAFLIIREWIDEVSQHPEMEFRGFVHEGKLNAVTQYFSFVYSQALVDRKNEISRLIREFFESISHNIPHPSYVIDFFVFQNDKVYIIELNPFHIGAGAGLFTWRENRQLFLEGPFEFRVLEKVPDDPREEIPIRWIKYLDAKYHPELLQKKKEEEEESPASQSYFSYCTIL